MIRTILAGLVLFIATIPAAFSQIDSLPPRTSDRPVIIRQQPLDENYREDGEEREIPWRAVPFKDKLRYGLNVTTPSLSFFGGSSIFSFDVSPMAGIRVTPTTTAGLGITYSYYTGPDGLTVKGREKLSLFGGRVFVQQHLNFIKDVVPGLFLWGEAEQYQVLSYRNSQGKINGYQFDPGFLIGGGYGAPVGEKGFQITLLYHTNYNSNPNTYSSSGSPLVIRIGWWFK
ncbi:hypothetical protein [Siphonobacter aquaeclarae]|uniref:Outer membrane protein beta-barrel domain-containing protein n=1 Tax=Siphonobacter aquaeclarae TaxID=563176 RepID=A0A1G9W728_9BACT|nr:hypothetical protein [Siphonobacter aquaeclarae]SDM80123.1 hypothetical protein SAMN04488090_4269 [Siphonobacter aquaeclarae]